MKSNRICAVITDKKQNIPQIAGIADLFELRIDLIGEGWEECAVKLPKAWIACNRRKEEGGKWQGSEQRRIEELLKALPLGAAIVDIELETDGLDKIVAVIKQKADCLISYHNINETPSFDALKDIVARQLEAGADICKVVTFANKDEDNFTVLRLIPQFPGKRVIAFAMGEKGLASRILCPIIGGDFTYAAIEKGAESAEGQLTVEELHQIYRMVQK
ncbi:MAG: type I 3-dehydroquinate dehydratase [Dehalococcoidales bacterium]|jgi:3-dehydroquinate dehydratase type I|nr:type I 3-dehydroquinate dehydratase [Dehalococcoidales bacterium]MDD3994674.1 type I 3-dehydroquinate dehydratase [Dehalococcoidales bacterium]